MPTSTATMTIPATVKISKLPVSTKKSVSSKSAIATLRSLYPRAARAFLQRDVALTHSLLLSAFSNLQPPLHLTADSLSSHRRKWDILRITLEAMLYTSGRPTDSLPESLRSILLLSPPPLVAMMHARSLQLFTPANRGKPSAEFLPSQILVALVLASVKLDCVQVGREMIEDWLSRRSGYDQQKDEKQLREEAEGYEKVMETYCLQVLPRLEDWDYAREFLRYESELAQDKRTFLVQSLHILRAQSLAHAEKLRERQRQVFPSPSSSRTPTPKPPSDRTPSPSPSSASTSTNSTHTAVPLTPRPHPIPSSSSSLTSLTPTPRARSPTQSRPSRSTAVTNRHSRTSTPLPVPPSAPQMPVMSVPSPSLLSLLKTYILPHLTTSNMTFLVLMFLVPLVSFVLRLRRRRIRFARSSGSTLTVTKPRGNAAEQAKRRLKAGWWAEICKAATDTVKMAGSGLV